MKVLPNEAEIKLVVSALEKGRQNAVPRKELSAVVGLSDRRVRACIEAARRAGTFIISSDSGYYIATEAEEVERQYRIDRARALSILQRLTPMRRYLRAAGRDLK